MMLLFCHIQLCILSEDFFHVAVGDAHAHPLVRREQQRPLFSGIKTFRVEERLVGERLVGL